MRSLEMTHRQNRSRSTSTESVHWRIDRCTRWSWVIETRRMHWCRSSEADGQGDLPTEFIFSSRWGWFAPNEDNLFRIKVKRIFSKTSIHVWHWCWSSPLRVPNATRPSAIFSRNFSILSEERNNWSFWKTHRNKNAS